MTPDEFLRRHQPKYFVLGPGNVIVPVADVLEWARWFETGKRHVAFDQIAPGVEVSTVFLGLDHRLFGDGPPILFETMVFDDYSAGDSERYCTWEEAEAGHRAMVEQVRARIAQAGTIAQTGTAVTC